MNLVSRLHRGCTYSAYTEEELEKRIKDADFQRSIFYRSRVYTYSCFARLLDDNSVELTEFFNNGETKKISNFKDKNDFWNGISRY